MAFSSLLYRIQRRHARGSKKCGAGVSIKRFEKASESLAGQIEDIFLPRFIRKTGGGDSTSNAKIAVQDVQECEKSRKLDTTIGSQ